MLEMLNSSSYDFYNDCARKMKYKYDMENIASEYIEIYNRNINKFV